MPRMFSASYQRYSCADTGTRRRRDAESAACLPADDRDTETRRRGDAEKCDCAWRTWLAPQNKVIETASETLSFTLCAFLSPIGPGDQSYELTDRVCHGMFGQSHSPRLVRRNHIEMLIRSILWFPRPHPPNPRACSENVPDTGTLRHASPMLEQTDLDDRRI